MFISFEGIDGCGKTTQLHLLNDYLTKLGYSVVAVREPGGTNVSEKIREILLDNRNNICKTAELLLFEAARAELSYSIIEPSLAKGSFVLSDRFIDSTLAYQGYGRELDIDSINILNAIATKTLVPDITFYFQLSLSIAKKRFEQNKLDRIEQSGDIFLQKVIDGFDTIALNNSTRVVVIDAAQSIDDIFNNIIRILVDKKIIA